MDGNALTPCAKGGKAVSKYIDVDVFIKSFREALPGMKAQVDPDLTPKADAFLRGGEAIIEDLTKFPAADVAPVVHGLWLCADTDTEQFFLCNRCKKKEYWESDYCPNCGAKMDGEGV